MVNDVNGALMKNSLDFVDWKFERDCYEKVKGCLKLPDDILISRKDAEIQQSSFMGQAMRSVGDALLERYMDQTTVFEAFATGSYLLNAARSGCRYL
ncbi:hypothetical protein CAEBREN_12975 [Caenorhabditis brenneri]|uniref:Uncharacterized protein n=1 Tax=Caenorhabditis brenneri TaxID=135651 RepID=G0P302_CAEBE|nr:hypothetical protein CAEBREN_12975 [Caenorhabditis brenneri]